MVTTTYRSSTLTKNLGNITKSTVTISASAISSSAVQPTIYVSNNDGSTWESATNGSEHTFSSTGALLRYRIDQMNGETITVRDASTGVDYPIICSYKFT